MSRRLALKIACVCEKDRSWIYQQLTDREKGIVVPLVEEAERMQLNKDPSVVSKIFLEEKSILDHQIDASMFSELGNVNELDVFWQKILLGCVDASQRNRLIGKFNLNLTSDDAVTGVPKAFKVSLIKYLRLKNESER